jgi:hypothetical protein
MIRFYRVMGRDWSACRFKDRYAGCHGWHVKMGHRMVSFVFFTEPRTA